ncbi:MAG: aldehyde ferredoxin oxidoreductase family protein [Anaerolineales bacterium]|nr:aldehyde ferredoxin oxidoreductase family protein [Anaerolineales bacterium]
MIQPVLTIDLTHRKISALTVPSKWSEDYLGGSSLAARILWEYLVPELDPLSPQAPLLFLNGPLTGTKGPATSRFVVSARSPATYLWGESNVGGFWGPELRKAGYYGLMVVGKSPSPVFIRIKDKDVSIEDARDVWGSETYTSQAKIQKRLKDGKYRIATIGPAGENQIPYALILTDHGRVAGRTGMGAIMGSKNLKAIAVRGSGDVPVASPDYHRIRSESNRMLKDDNLSRATRELGTAGIADYADYLGEMPKKYFHSGVFEGVSKISGSTMTESILTGVRACHACVIACGRIVTLSDSKKHKGPEYETIVGFGPNLLIDDLEFITRMGELCDCYGMDTISLSNTIGLAFTLFEKGVITEKDTGGLRLKWGAKDVIEELVHQTGRNEGFGTVLAHGARSLAARFGLEEEAIQVNGLEVPYHDPRGASGMAISYATSPRGACHNQSDYFFIDVLGHIEESLGMEYVDPNSDVEKVSNIIIHQNWRTLLNSLVSCYFANVPPETTRDLVNAATGLEYSLNDLLRIGERSWNLKRMINWKFGLRKENDKLPKELLKPYMNGGAKGYKFPFQEMMNAYYRARKWDNNTGFPTQEKTDELSLEWASFESFD